MKCLREPGTEVIWSNVLIDEDKVPHWVGNGEEHPEEGHQLPGRVVGGQDGRQRQADPDLASRTPACTLANAAIGNYNEAAAEDPAGRADQGHHLQRPRQRHHASDLGGQEPRTTGVVIGASIVSAATATEVGATGVKRQPWANAPFIPGALADYMDAQFKFFNSDKLNATSPIMAGLNYFLTHGARGGEGTKLLGEKRDVKVWLGWLERRAHGDVDAIETPIGYIPKYDDLKELFAEHRQGLPARPLRQAVLLLRRQHRRPHRPAEGGLRQGGRTSRRSLFEVYDEQRQGLMALKEKYGPVVTPTQLAEAAVLA